MAAVGALAGQWVLGKKREGEPRAGAGGAASAEPTKRAKAIKFEANIVLMKRKRRK